MPGLGAATVHPIGSDFSSRLLLAMQQHRHMSCGVKRRVWVVVAALATALDSTDHKKTSRVLI